MIADIEAGDIPGNSVDDVDYEKWFDADIEELAFSFVEEINDQLIELVIDGSLLDNEFRLYCLKKYESEKEGGF